MASAVSGFYFLRQKYLTGSGEHRVSLHLMAFAHFIKRRACKVVCFYLFQDTGNLFIQVTEFARFAGIECSIDFPNSCEQIEQSRNGSQWYTGAGLGSTRSTISDVPIVVPYGKQAIKQGM